jgi:hypothetical protein
MKTIENVEEDWTALANKHLRGARIMKVEYMTKNELEDNMWYKSPLCLLMKKPNGEQFWMYPSMDDEGNDGGSLFTTIKEYSYVPTI